MSSVQLALFILHCFNPNLIRNYPNPDSHQIFTLYLLDTWDIPEIDGQLKFRTHRREEDGKLYDTINRLTLRYH